MDLPIALQRLAPLLTKDRIYVRADKSSGRVMVTDFTHWMSINVGAAFDYCVPHARLLTATDVEGETIVLSPDGDNGVIVTRRGSRVRVKGVDKVYVPDPPSFDDGVILDRIIPPVDLRDVLRRLRRWIDPEGAVWMQGLHISDNMIWVVNRQEAVAYLYETELLTTLTLPHWLVKTLCAAPATAIVRELVEYASGILVNYEDGTQVFSLKLSDPVPESAEMFVDSNLVMPVADVPDGLGRAVDMLGEYDVPHMLLGGGKAKGDGEGEQQVEVEVDVAVHGDVRKWKVKNFVDALPMMERIALEPSRCLWAGGPWRGIFMGMTK